MSVWCVFVAVKYLREVTPYFRKTSALNEVGWSDASTSSVERPSLASSPSPSPVWLAERKSMPLRLCYVCRNMSVADADGRTIELHSADARHVCLLRCADAAAADKWFRRLLDATLTLLRRATADASRLLDGVPGSRGDVRHMGWLAEQVGDGEEEWGVTGRTACGGGGRWDEWWMVEPVGDGGDDWLIVI